MKMVSPANRINLKTTQTVRHFVLTFSYFPKVGRSVLRRLRCIISEYEKYIILSDVLVGSIAIHFYEMCCHSEKTSNE